MVKRRASAYHRANHCILRCPCQPMMGVSVNPAPEQGDERVPHLVVIGGFAGSPDRVVQLLSRLRRQGRGSRRRPGCPS